MTVSVPAQLEFVSNGDGVTTSFSYPVRFLEKSDVIVAFRDADGVDTVKTLNVDYTIAGTIWPTGGNVVFGTAPANGVKVVRYRSTAAKQVVDLSEKAKNSAESVELQLDRTMMAVQDSKSLTSSTSLGLQLEILARKAGDAALGTRIDLEEAARIAKDDDLQEEIDILNSAIGITDPEAFRVYLDIDQVDNTSDANKPISLATQFALNGKVDDAEIVGMLKSSDIGVSVQARSPNLDELALVNPDTAGKTILAASLASDVRNFLDVAVYVEDRTAAKAIDTTKDTVLYLKEAGREGVFKWTAGNFTSLVAADPQEGMYIKATAIAASAGAWVRQRDGLDLNVLWFGASTAIANNAVAFNAAAALFSYADIFIPGDNTSDIYDFTASVTWQGKFLKWSGAGKTLTTLRWTTDVDGFVFGGTSAAGVTVFEDMTLLTQVAAGTRHAIRGTLNSQVRNNFSARRLEVRGEDINNDYWGYGIRTFNALLPIFEDLQFFGKSSTLSADWSLTEAAILCEADSGVAIYKFDNIYAINYDRGIWMRGSTNPTMEGIFVTRSNIVYGNYGYVFDYGVAPSAWYSPHIDLRSCHAEVAVNALLALQCREIFIDNVLFYCTPWENIIGAGALVYVEDCKYVNIDNVHIEMRPIATTARGIQIASCDRVTIGQNVRGLTPGDLCIFTGTTSNAVSKLTTKSQFGTGPVFSDVSSAAATNKGTFSIGTTGYQWNGDVLEQWGSLSGTPNASSHLVVNFPRAFPNTCYNVVASNGDALAGVETVAVFSKSLTGFVVYFGGATTTRRVDWIAKGN